MFLTNGKVERRVVYWHIIVHKMTEQKRHDSIRLTYFERRYTTTIRRSLGTTYIYPIVSFYLLYTFLTTENHPLTSTHVSHSRGHDQNYFSFHPCSINVLPVFVVR